MLDTRSHYYKWISSLPPYTHTHTPACTYRTSVGLIKFGCYSKVPVSILIHSFLPQIECLENSRVRYLSYSHGAWTLLERPPFRPPAFTITSVHENFISIIHITQCSLSVTFCWLVPPKAASPLEWPTKTAPFECESSFFHKIPCLWKNGRVGIIHFYFLPKTLLCFKISMYAILVCVSMMSRKITCRPLQWMNETIINCSIRFRCRKVLHQPPSLVWFSCCLVPLDCTGTL